MPSSAATISPPSSWRWSGRRPAIRCRKTLVGRLYAEGLGVKQSDRGGRCLVPAGGACAAIRQRRLALGLLYLDGKGVKKDKAKAADAFEQAAGWNDPAALYNLGLLYLDGEVRPRDPAEGGASCSARRRPRAISTPNTRWRSCMP